MLSPGSESARHRETAPHHPGMLLLLLLLLNPKPQGPGRLRMPSGSAAGHGHASCLQELAGWESQEQ